MGVGAAVEADDGEVDAVVGAHNLGVAFGVRADGYASSAYREGVEEFSSGDHVLISLGLSSVFEAIERRASKTFQLRCAINVHESVKCRPVT